jgi:hypothetical protein
MPNHAEWVTCLGAAWKFSTWEGREGLDFVLEAQAREQADEYMGVCRLEWVADAFGETPIHGKLNPNSLWRSLALLQKHRLANITKATAASDCTEKVTRSILDENSGDCFVDETADAISFQDNGTIIVPAVACTTPQKGNKKTKFMKSFLGGRQLHIREDQSVEYTLELKETRQYHLSIRVVTVHGNMQPLLLQITTSGNDDSNKRITVGTVLNVPYTKGEWQMTDPVEIALGSGTNVLSFTRKEPPHFGLTMKELVLTPVTEPTNCINVCFE